MSTNTIEIADIFAKLGLELNPDGSFPYAGKITDAADKYLDAPLGSNPDINLLTLILFWKLDIDDYELVSPEAHLNRLIRLEAEKHV